MLWPYSKVITALDSFVGKKRGLNCFYPVTLKLYVNVNYPESTKSWIYIYHFKGDGGGGGGGGGVWNYDLNIFSSILELKQKKDKEPLEIEVWLYV